MVLKNLTPQAEGGAAGDPNSCAHWVISEELSSKTGPCSTCKKKWATLVEECDADQILSYSQAFPCTNLQGHSFLEHGGYLSCSHCGSPKTDHIIKWLTQIVGSIVVDPTLPPPADSEHAAKTFDLYKVMAALADAYHDKFISGLADWRVQMKSMSQVMHLLSLPPNVGCIKNLVRSARQSSWQQYPM